MIVFVIRNTIGMFLSLYAANWIDLGHVHINERLSYPQLHPCPKSTFYHGLPIDQDQNWVSE